MPAPVSPQDRRLFRAAVEAALSLDDLALAGAFTLDRPFGLRFEDDRETWFGAVDEGTLLLARGPAGLRWLRDEADDVALDEDLERGVERIETRLRYVADIHPLERRPLERSGVVLHRDDVAPEFRAKLRNRSPHDLRARDAKRLATAVHALRWAVVEQVFEDELPGDPELTVLAVSGDWRAPRVDVTREVHADDLGRTASTVRCTAETSAWPAEDGAWSVGVADSGVGLPTLLVVDRATGAEVGACAVEPQDAFDAARAFVRGAWLPPDDEAAGDDDAAGDGERDAEDRDDADDAEGGERDAPPGGFARELTFHDAALRDLVAPALADRGVVCALVERDDVFERAAAAPPPDRDDAPREEE